MTHATKRALGGSFVIVLATLAATSCTDEKVVFQDRELFEEPLPAALGALGYSNQDAKLTTCGNCHVGPQSQWQETAHAGAWESLQASGSAQEFCSACHTVSELGNTMTDPMGYTATAEDRYQDVQCESCHGPGLPHVQNPNDATVPLAPLSVGVALTAGCGECHQGSHNPFVEEWSESGHGEVINYPAGRAGCEDCHTGEAALEAWGVSDDYLEKAQVAGLDENLPITCAVCHDPHGSANPAQLRFPIDVPSEDQNLCMKCHHKRGTPDPASFRGPHSPEGPLLLGVAGWWPPMLEFPGNSITTSHGSEENPGLCAGCHVNSFTVTDAATGDFTFRATGHLFEATPCLDDAGVPTREPCGEQEKTFQACAACHAQEGETARGLLFTAESRLDFLADELDLLIAQIPATEFDQNDNRYTTGEGSKFNAALARTGGAAAHNATLIEALLIASIRQVRADYGLAVSANVSLERLLGTNP